MSTKVTMALSERDLENVRCITELPAIRSRTHAVSAALALMRFIIDTMRQKGTQLILRNPDGSFERLLMPELELGMEQQQEYSGRN